MPGTYSAPGILRAGLAVCRGNLRGLRTSSDKLLAGCRRERLAFQKPGFWSFSEVFLPQKCAFFGLKTGFLNLSDKLLGQGDVEELKDAFPEFDGGEPEVDGQGQTQADHDGQNRNAEVKPAGPLWRWRCFRRGIRRCGL